MVGPRARTRMKLLSTTSWLLKGKMGMTSGHGAKSLIRACIPTYLGSVSGSRRLQRSRRWGISSKSMVMGSIDGGVLEGLFYSASRV